MGNETLKLPPQNVEAEQSVLGAMLLDGEAVIQVLEFLSSEHFYKESHQKIFSAMSRNWLIYPMALLITGFGAFYYLQHKIPSFLYL